MFLIERHTSCQVAGREVDLNNSTAGHIIKFNVPDLDLCERDLSHAHTHTQTRLMFPQHACNSCFTPNYDGVTPHVFDEANEKCVPAYGHGNVRAARLLRMLLRQPRTNINLPCLLCGGGGIPTRTCVCVCVVYVSSSHTHTHTH